MQKKLFLQTWSQWLVIFSGALTFFLGFFGLFGKQISYLSFFQMEPANFVMAYDTSFCFFVAGIAVITVFSQRCLAVTKILAAILITMGILTGIEYALKIDWHIAQRIFFMLNGTNVYPSKMRPINAICFLTTGVLFWNMASQKIPTHRMTTLAIWISALWPAFAIFSLFGYLVRIENSYAYDWEILAPMSINASVGFILLSLGIVGVIINFYQRFHVNLERALPIFITVFISLLSLLFWHFFVAGENLRISPHYVKVIGIIKELAMSSLIGIAIYFMQISRHYGKNAERLFLLAKESADRLAYQAAHDTLTGLANRFIFLSHIEWLIDNAKNSQRKNDIFALLFFDLDRFKVVNDSLGHDVGDELLKAIVARLKKITRQEDLLARLGGDEFVLLVPDMHDERNIIKIVEKYLSAFSMAFSVDGHELHLGCSIGVSIYPKDGIKASVLLKNADIAMYRAKRENQSFLFYTTKMQQEITERLSLENDLQFALEKNEFVLYYQPIIDLRSGKISALEALIRWKSPSRGLVEPAEFIPIAEEIGILAAMGEWVLRSACAQNKIWQESGFLVARMHVNISEKQIKQEYFYHLIVQILQEIELDPQYLSLELTESVLMKDISHLKDVFQQLKEMNVKLSIDDFGAEYSSLGRLRHLPFDTLKMDKSFLMEVPQNSSDRAIVLTILTMAKNLNLRVVAEGVETKEQLEFLRANACDEIQGYYFSKPLTVSQLEASMPDLELKIKGILEPIALMPA